MGTGLPAGSNPYPSAINIGLSNGLDTNKPGYFDNEGIKEIDVTIYDPEDFKYQPPPPPPAPIPQPQPIPEPI